MLLAWKIYFHITVHTDEGSIHLTQRKLVPQQRITLYLVQELLLEDKRTPIHMTAKMLSGPTIYAIFSKLLIGTVGLNRRWQHNAPLVKLVVMSYLIMRVLNLALSQRCCPPERETKFRCEFRNRSLCPILAML